jgi:hypothetical protein
MLAGGVRHVPRLYPEVLGAAWDELDAAVRQLHGADTPVQARGVFRIRHGSSPLARLLARLMRLPLPGEFVDVRLSVTPGPNGEEWRRIFAGRPLITFQTRRDNRLVERLGIVEIRFHLTVARGELIYESTGAALCAGSLRIRLPHRLAPRVAACEKPGGAEGRIAVSVDVSLPVLGRLIAYEGTLTQIEAAR